MLSSFEKATCSHKAFRWIIAGSRENVVKACGVAFVWVCMARVIPCFMKKVMPEQIEVSRGMAARQALEGGKPFGSVGGFGMFQTVGCSCSNIGMRRAKANPYYFH